MNETVTTVSSQAAAGAAVISATSESQGSRFSQRMTRLVLELVRPSDHLGFDSSAAAGISGGGVAERGVKIHIVARPAHTLKKEKLIESVGGMRIMDDVGIRIHKLKHLKFHGKMLLAE